MALVVLGLSLGALFSAISGGTDLYRAAQREALLSRHAQSALDLMAASAVSGLGRDEGVLPGGVAWTGEAAARAGAAPASGLLPMVIRVEVRLSGEPDRALRLETVRLVPRGAVGGGGALP